MRRVDCLSDLVTRARRYRLSPTEQARLQEHLLACASCRHQQQVGAAFDAVGALKPGDEVLIANLASKSVGRLTGGTPAFRPRLRSLSMAAAVAGVLVSAMAGAAVLLHARSSPPADVVVQQPAPPDPPRAPQVRPKFAAPLLAAEALPPAPTSVPSPIPKVRSTRVAAPPPPVEVAVQTSSSSLFADANRERRQANADAAIALYEQLEQQYPDSEEARVAHVSLGRLLLERGAWSRALSQLDLYVSEAPYGLLAPEALFGRAQALRGLGQRDEEREAWARLLTRSPDSVYAGQARRRIEELR
jgi:hypothetical protein